MYMLYQFTISLLNYDNFCFWEPRKYEKAQQQPLYACDAIYIVG